MPKMHLKQPGLTYSVCGPLANELHKSIIRKFKKRNLFIIQR